MNVDITTSLPEDSHSDDDIDSGVPEETAEFSKLATGLVKMSRESDLWTVLRFAGNVDFDGNTKLERLVGALLHDERTYPENPELVQRFNSIYEDLADHVASRTSHLVDQTSLAERESQVYILSSVPINTEGETGLQDGMISLIISKMDNKDDLITTGAIGQYRSRAEEKIFEGMRTRFLAQYLGHPPEGFPEHPNDRNIDPEVTIPLRSETLSRLRKRHWRASRGTTYDDIVSDMLDETRTVVPLKEFVERYMDSQPAAGMVLLTNMDSSKSLHIQGVVESEASIGKGSTTMPLRGLNRSQSPYDDVRPNVVRETDAVRVDGVVKNVEWGETIGYRSIYMEWIYTDMDQEWGSTRPDLSLEDCVHIVSDWVN